MKLCKTIFFIIPIIVLTTSCSVIELLSATKVIAETYPSDNPIETRIEEIIEDKTSLDIDISFWNPDNDKHSWSEYLKKRESKEN